MTTILKGLRPCPFKLAPIIYPGLPGSEGDDLDMSGEMIGYCYCLIIALYAQYVCVSWDKIKCKHIDIYIYIYTPAWRAYKKRMQIFMATLIPSVGLSGTEMTSPEGDDLEYMREPDFYSNGLQLVAGKLYPDVHFHLMASNLAV